MWDMYADYINGKREIAEINMDFKPDVQNDIAPEQERKNENAVISGQTGGYDRAAG